VLTAVPCTCQTAIWRHDTELQWGSVMGAVGAHGVGIAALLDQQDFAILNTLDLDLTLLSVLEVEGGDPFELELLSHGSE